MPKSLRELRQVKAEIEIRIGDILPVSQDLARAHANIRKAISAKIEAGRAAEDGDFEPIPLAIMSHAAAAVDAPALLSEEEIDALCAKYQPSAAAVDRVSAEDGEGGSCGSCCSSCYASFSSG